LAETAHACLNWEGHSKKQEQKMEWQRYEFRVSTDPRLLQLAVIHDFLRQTYWAKEISEQLVSKALDGSLCFGLYQGERQIGLARVITDRATFAYLSDVFVLDEFQGQGLGQWLVSCVLAHPELQGLRRIMLATLDAHELYRKLGFSDVTQAEQIMEIRNVAIAREAGNRLG
jgi:GNAT superfamily N-acetyltransferase